MIQTFYYLAAALLALFFCAQILFDLWLYRTTKSLDFVLSAWANRHKQHASLTNHQQIAQRYLCLLERIAIAVAIALLLVKLLQHS